MMEAITAPASFVTGIPADDEPEPPELSPADTIRQNVIQYLQGLNENTTHYQWWLIGKRQQERDAETC